MAVKVAQEIRLGDLFVKEGLITEEQLQEGLAEAKTAGGRPATKDVLALVGSLPSPAELTGIQIVYGKQTTHE